MKKFEITKEQILQLNSYNNYDFGVALKQWFPQAFESELEVGKWYKWHGGILHITKIVGNSAWFYGVDEYGYWRKKDWYSKSHEIRPELATDKEVETALIAEAKRRGFNKTTMITQTFNENQKMCIGFWDESSIEFTRNKLFAKGVRIFDNGKWAEIISKPIELTLEQRIERIEEQLKIKK